MEAQEGGRWGAGMGSLRKWLKPARCPVLALWLRAVTELYQAPVLSCLENGHNRAHAPVLLEGGVLSSVPDKVKVCLN